MPTYKEENGTWTVKFKYKNAAGEKNKRGFEQKKDADAWESPFKSRS